MRCARLDAQVRQFTRAGCKKVFREVASGAETDCTQRCRAPALLAVRMSNGSDRCGHVCPAPRLLQAGSYCLAQRYRIAVGGNSSAQAVVPHDLGRQ